MRFLRRSLVGLFLIVGDRRRCWRWPAETGWRAVQARLAEEPPGRRAAGAGLRGQRGAGRAARDRPRYCRSSARSAAAPDAGDPRHRRRPGGLAVRRISRKAAQVAAGELLVRIDPADAESALKLAESDRARGRGGTGRRRPGDRRWPRTIWPRPRTQATLREQALARQRDARARGVGSRYRGRGRRTDRRLGAAGGAVAAAGAGPGAGAAGDREDRRWTGRS